MPRPPVEKRQEQEDLRVILPKPLLGLLDTYAAHLSEERAGQNITRPEAVREILIEKLVPWSRERDALSKIRAENEENEEKPRRKR